MDMRYEDIFPGLAQTGYQITSPATPTYNCMGWAAGSDGFWYEPDPNFDYYWPPGIPREYTLDAYIQVYMLLGYSACRGGDLEEGFEKVAIFTDGENLPTHASRQLSSGQWTSKLGQANDISHILDALEGDKYGHIAVFLKRPLP